jgi:hypothetical protein
LRSKGPRESRGFWFWVLNQKTDTSGFSALRAKNDNESYPGV